MIDRILVVTPFALAVALAAFVTVTAPASAAPVDCVALPAQLRAAAATATPDLARKALVNVRTGEALCAADSKFEAGRKFAAAARVLGVDTAQLTTASSAPAASN